ncbi:hypothetical protein L195_g051632 [Trifolium pratense]|uniref:Uncharacterized protein n=1 Tax=Trifolium pratense TaxID=57577 RepID=A0A2K3K0M8_TRIPR|nr:hypothetical protein L195_g051632 [Trifolium pratense]
MILYGMSCVLHLPIKGLMLDYTGNLTKDEGDLLMVELIRSRSTDVDKEVTHTRGAHARFTYLRDLFGRHWSVWVDTQRRVMRRKLGSIKTTPSGSTYSS